MELVLNSLSATNKAVMLLVLDLQMDHHKQRPEGSSNVQNHSSALQIGRMGIISDN